MLAPTHLVVLPVSEAESDACEVFLRRCIDAGLRARIAGSRDGSLGARVRAERLVPYQVVIGANEAADGRVSLRLRDGRRLEPRPADEILACVRAAIYARDTELWGVDMAASYHHSSWPVG